MTTVLKRAANGNGQNNNNKNNNKKNDIETALSDQRNSSDRFQLRRSAIREQANNKWQKGLFYAIVVVGLFLSLTFLLPFAKKKKYFTTNQELRSAVEQYIGKEQEKQREVKAIYGDPIGSWDVSQVTDFSHCQFGGRFNEDISKWDVTKAKNMVAMFFSASSFNGDLSQWNVSSVTSMYEMFNGANSFNGDLSQWNVSSVTNMGLIFNGATAFKSDLSQWNVSSVTIMLSMFDGATSFNSDLKPVMRYKEKNVGNEDIGNDKEDNA